MFGLGITLFSLLIAYLLGSATVLIFIWYWLNIQENDQNTFRKHSLHETKLPDSLLELVQEKETGGYKRRETCIALNLVLQFFFQERRYDLDIASWLTNLLTLEFSELIKHRTLSKIINKMEIQHLNLGNNFPVLKSVTPLNVQFVKDSSLLKNIEVNVEVEYTGGFQIVIDAVTKLSKKAVVKIKVVRLSGKACLELSRYPFTHWSFSFYEEPESEFEVESSVLGRQIPRFKTIIINQLRSLIKRKHTLPYYKLRFAPLIKKTPKIASSALTTQLKEDIIPSGILHVTLLRCSRLQPCLVGSSLYFSMTLSEAPLVCAYETSVGVWIVQDIFVTKLHSSPMGVLLRNADDNSQIIETVSGKSVAFLAGLRKNDIILAVNNIPLGSGSQAAKLFAPTSSSSFRKSQTSHDLSIRIKRLIYTDHKRGSVDPSLLDNSFNIVEENATSRTHQVTPVPLPLDEDSIDSAYTSAESIDKLQQKGVEGLGEKIPLFTHHHHSRSLGKVSTSGRSTPESSRSSSPELKPRSLNIPVEEKSGTESPPDKNAASVPIQIPQSSKLDDTLFYQDPRNSSNTPQTSKAGTPTSGLQEFIPHSLPLGIAVLKLDSKKESKKTSNKSRPIIKHFETSPIEGIYDPVIGNDFKFQLDEESKFLNICVWSKTNYQDLEKQTSNEKFTTAKEVISKLRKREMKENEKESEKKTWTKEQGSRISNPEPPNPMTGHPDCILVGLINIPVDELIEATKLNTQGSVTKLFNLQPGDPNCPEIADHPLLAHKGFDPALCYGDLMVYAVHQHYEKATTQYKPTERASLGSVLPTGEEECLTDTTLSDEEDGGNQDDWKEERDHVFKRTHFSSATQCSFCKKKIWLKDAYQCSECGVICHKKCMLRCQQATVCDFGGLRYREIKDQSLKEEFKPMPEIVMTVDSQIQKNDNKLPPTMLSPRHTLSSFLSHISSPSGSLKRTGSAQNLAPPLQGSELGLSRSLPPSPQHTPRSSRKNSLVGSPFAVEDTGDGNHLDLTLEKLMSWPRDDQLVCLARETSSQLYSNLEPKERERRIKRELDVLQSRVEREGEIRVDLAQQEKEASERKDSVQRTRLALLISECDARTQALALLTMHFFTAQQKAQQQQIKEAGS